nr:ABC transporter ATP-binding protein [Paeniclostridium ghonii]MCM0165672.1 ABC transporter ATP-binding protein [Paeniclostridium ghonii]
MLHVDNLTKTYNNKIVAIKDLSFSLNKNKVLGLVGPNGSGKTTTINLILGTIKSNSGKILYENHKNDSLEFKKKVGYIPDELILPESLTGREYIEFILSVYSIKKNDKLNKLIKLYNMQDFLDILIKEYSHGMKKKIQIIVAFSLESELIIIDEPFRGLDVESIIITKQLFKSFINSGSILLCSHDLNLIEELADEVIMLYKGNTVAKGTSSFLKEKFGCKALEEVFMNVSIGEDRKHEIGEIISNFNNNA